jgi:Domain of Unknown Function (DUF1080)
MRAILSLCTLLAVTLPCQAQDKKPNTLTPKEIADGWILLFDGETTFGWKGQEEGGQPKVTDGALVVSAAGLCSRTGFSEFELRFEYKLDKEDAFAGIQKLIEENTRADTSYLLPKAMEWTPRVMRVSKMTVSVESPGKQRGTIELQRAGPWEITFGRGLILRSIKLKPLNTEPIFNGKDLAGWKEFPGKKSKFTVTDKGEINVKDGPGDLQTIGKYQNFMLQLECISNGKHLNSGIFFRCRDNEYQNGYEAQIRNQFTAEATQDYVIEEYDPKTNKLLEKKKIKATAVDYGTGAIYRRQPARKEMSKDGEWFSMTVIAQGNHLATWVNGVQVTDWYDYRPISDNARTGCKLEAGHISIQGHDPTTNLSFRNLRIVELPSGK